MKSPRLPTRAFAAVAALATLSAHAFASDAYWLGNGLGIGPNGIVYDNWYGETGPYRDHLYFASEYSILGQLWLSHSRDVDFRGLVQTYGMVNGVSHPLPGLVSVVDGDWNVRFLKDWSVQDGRQLQMVRQGGYTLQVGGGDDGHAPKATHQATLSLFDSDFAVAEISVSRFAGSVPGTASLLLARSVVTTDSLIVGEVGRGFLNVSGGSILSIASRMHVGNYNQAYYPGQNPVESRESTVTVHGAGSAIVDKGLLEFDRLGSTSLSVLAGGRVESQSMSLAMNGGKADVLVSGTGSLLKSGYVTASWNRDGGALIPDWGTSITIEKGALAILSELRLGELQQPLSGGSLTVDDATLQMGDGLKGSLYLTGRSTLTVDHGAAITSMKSFVVGYWPGSKFAGRIMGASTLDSDAVRIGGFGGTGRITVSEGATLFARTAGIGGTAELSSGTLTLMDGGGLVLTADPSRGFPKGDLTIYTDDVVDVSGGGYARVGSLTKTLGAVVVGRDGKLDGDGRIVGDLIVEPGGIVAPGYSPGTLHIDGDAFLGGILQMEVVRTSSDLTHDLLQVTGDVTLGGTLDLTFTGVLGNDRLTLISGRSLSGSFARVNLPAGFEFFSSGNEAWVQTQAVPEPASLAALSLGTFALLRRRKVA